MANKNEALKELIFDALQELREFIKRIELREIFEQGSKKKICVIVFSNFFALQEWNVKKDSILCRMRELYKQRELKEIIVFHRVLAEVYGQNLFYKERSKGEFEIASNNPKIRDVFEKIKVSIKENLKREII